MAKTFNLKEMENKTGISEIEIMLAFNIADTVPLKKTLEHAMRNYKNARNDEEKRIAIKQIAHFFME